METRRRTSLDELTNAVNQTNNLGNNHQPQSPHDSEDMQDMAMSADHASPHALHRPLQGHLLEIALTPIVSTLEVADMYIGYNIYKHNLQDSIAKMIAQRVLRPVSSSTTQQKTLKTLWGKVRTDEHGQPLTKTVKVKTTEFEIRPEYRSLFAIKTTHIEFDRENRTHYPAVLAADCEYTIPNFACPRV